MIERGLIIGGVEQAAASGETFDVLSPATEQVIGRVARGAKADVDLAVAAARNGFTQWHRLTPSAREAVLLRAADIMAEQGEQRYLDLLIDESGSVINKARYEIARTADLLRAAAGEVRRLYGETMPNDSPDRISMVFREPLGVVAAIVPYNAPLLLLTKMTAFPLAAGNSIVIKPSEETPLIAIEYAKLLVEAGLPADAVSVVTGFGAECGSPLVEHDDINAIALTGSTATGKAIGKIAMEKMRPTQLELGGKSALVVLNDFDAKSAAKIAIEGMFTHAGQICMANSRIVVEAGIFDEFIAELKAGCEQLVVGDVRDTKSAYGPLINRNALNKVLAHIEDAKSRGTALLTGGEVHQGLTLQPTVLLEPSREATAWRDESFGPLTSVVKAQDLDDAIALANDSVFALSAAVLTHNIQRGFKAAREIRSGAVHIGMHSFQSNAMAPIGGMGDSGIGRSGGKYSTEEFTELKWISVELGG
ncbi:aldehyde dehydrogenase [Oceanicoccus sp. KOV_DT_Chl]|uniref:aldehyde dehydrogenase family protein n=1 Tax=Oceanicoccus sp. KOV_DT_Chl TaxID=1904639 RepID=UPI000C7D8E48|nr:aldehyde dehydrogenase family protein [Oceanicoccus sp. KOV_DT_Chl]